MSESSPPSAEPEVARTSRAPLVDRSVASLDWPRIVEALTERAATGLGAERCMDLPFCDSALEARLALAEAGEMMTLHQAGFAPPLGSIEDVREQLGGATKGEILTGQPLTRIAHTLEGLERLHRHLAQHAALAPKLHSISTRIRPLPDLAAWLQGSFDSRGELSASSYPQLSSLRGRKSKLHARIRDTLVSLRGEDRFTDSLQDDFLAMRNDRYVVPVKSAQKRAGLGIVHDTSGSGQTVFIEPYEVIELNNDLKMADAELRQEERRILRDLTERVALVAGDVARSLQAAAHLDLVSAKAILGMDLDAGIPRVPDEPILKLREARHPILALRGIEVVPNDVTLGGEHRALVLSGPNTGGKTVTLKTMGLFALMVRAGLPVPADPDSEVGFFGLVLTDIGDQQDVQEDLSTFSGHVLCLVEILDELDAASTPSLVLVDEIAVGTDPVQGAALGRALLMALLDHDVLLATTTHYPELKALSATDERFRSGRVEFDAEQARPTYRLTVGRPGSSHALDVAARVGLPEAILATARGLLDPTTADVEDLLAGLETELGAARDARVQAEADKARVHGELAELRRERDELERRSRGLERKHRADFEREVRGYRAAVRGAMKEIRQKQDEASVERARQRISEGAGAVRDQMGVVVETPSVDRIDPATLTGGMAVRVSTLGKEARVLTLPDRRGRLQVEVDGLRLQVPAADLERSRGGPSAGGKKKKRARPVPERASRSEERVVAAAAGLDNAFRSPSNTLDLRGERVDDALEKVERFLDDASMDHEPFVFILHGHGTGALKKAIRTELKRSTYAAEFGSGSRAQGGDGITVVRLK
jgi:DNA mismatch repair protein MutS2